MTDTPRLARDVARLRAATSLLHATPWFDSNRDAVKLDLRPHPERTPGPADLDGVTMIAMGEFAIQKGHC